MDTDATRFERIPLAEWDRLKDALGRFCSGDVESGDGTLTCRAGAATFTVTRDGTVEAGMPLHGFTAAGVTAVGVDVDERELLVETDGTRYVFRHP